MKILIVDDDRVRGEKLTLHLIEKGVISQADVATATCAIEAKKLLQAAYYDVLILDVVLPLRDKEKCDASIGIAFLQQITEISQYKKPARIIGITAHVTDIATFKAEFEKYCLTVIEASPRSSVWKDKCAEAISYLSASQLARSVTERPLHVLAVHGIHTFGGWQTRLAHLISTRTGGIAFSAYKYEYFSFVAFFLWFLRNREVQRLEDHLDSLFQTDHESSFIIYCHSFGTYLVAHALKRLVAKGRNPPVKLLVLAGSVLSSRFDWSFIENFGPKRAFVVNDCAEGDYVLWLSEAFVLGTGMAGKTGFYGINGPSVVNRYFKGGHSSYFDGDSFMRNNWLSLLDVNDSVGMLDSREPSFVEHGLLEKTVCVAGRLKPYVYWILVILGLYWCLI